MFLLLRGFSKSETGGKGNPKCKQDNLKNISHSSGPHNYPPTATLPLPEQSLIQTKVQKQLTNLLCNQNSALFHYRIVYVCPSSKWSCCSWDGLAAPDPCFFMQWVLEETLEGTTWYTQTGILGRPHIFFLTAVKKSKLIDLQKPSTVLFIIPSIWKWKWFVGSNIGHYCLMAIC